MAKKISGLLAVLTAAAALAVPAVAHDRDDYNYDTHGNSVAYGAYTAYNGYNAYAVYGGHSDLRREEPIRKDNRSRDRRNDNRRDVNYRSGDHDRR